MICDLEKKGNNKKESVLYATLRILFKEGRINLTTRRLVEESGVSKGSIYYHFKNMEEILSESFKFLMQKHVIHYSNLKFGSLEEIFIWLFDDAIKTLKRSNLSPHIFWVMIHENQSLLVLLKEFSDKIFDNIINLIEKASNKKLSIELKKYIREIIKNYIAGLKLYHYLQKGDIDIKLKNWKRLSKHLIEEILND